MIPKWLRAITAQIDALPQRERLALLMAGIALLAGTEFMVILPLQDRRLALQDLATLAAQEEERQKTAQADERARQEEEIDQRLKAANEALRALGVSSGMVGTRGESLSFLLSRTLGDSPVQVVSLHALEADEMSLAARPGEEVSSADPAKPQRLYRHRYVLGLAGEFTAITQALERLQDALKPLRLERVKLQARPDGSVLATVHWVTIGLEKSWLSL